MKKLLLVILVGLMAGSYGAVNVNWAADSGFYFSATPSVGILGDGTGKSTIAQLMYSPDNTKDGILTTLAGNVNDIVWDTYTLTENGTTGDFDDYAFFGASFGTLQNYTQAFTNGYIYALIFQDNNVQVGDWYFYTPMIALQDIVAPGLPQSIQMNTDLTNGNAIDSGATTAQVVPEPATFLLFGMGGMGAWLIRRNRLKSKEEADA